MEQLPPVTVIVLNWNAQSLLDRCLQALQSLDYPGLQIVVVDNASTDGSVAYLQRHYPQVRLLLSDTNRGFSGGNNLFLRKLETPIAVLLNPDVFVDKGWLRALVAGLLSEEDVGIAGCKLRYPQGNVLQHAGGYLTEPRGIPNHFGVGEVDGGQWDEPRDVSYVLGGALALRGEVLERIGFLDEGFFLYYEDVDFCTRARAAGYRVVYVPQATAVHAESATTVKDSPAYLRHFHRGRWRYLLKHISPARLLSETIPAEQAWLEKTEERLRLAAASAYHTALQQYLGGKMGIEADAAVVEGMLTLYRSAWQLPAKSLAPTTSSWRVEERLFVSQAPILGPLFVRLRTAWLNVAARWYVRGLLAQQNEINQGLGELISGTAAWAYSQGGEQPELLANIAEVRQQLAQTSARLARIDERLRQLEAGEEHS